MFQTTNQRTIDSQPGYQLTNRFVWKCGEFESADKSSRSLGPSKKMASRGVCRENPLFQTHPNVSVGHMLHFNILSSVLVEFPFFVGEQMGNPMNYPLRSPRNHVKSCEIPMFTAKKKNMFHHCSWLNHVQSPCFMVFQHVEAC